MSGNTRYFYPALFFGGRHMNESLTEGNVLKSLVKFAIPFLLTNLLQSLYGSVDLLIVGRFASTQDVSGVTIGSQCMALATFIIIGLTTGTTVALGQYAGAKKENDIVKTIGSSVLLFAFVAFLLTAASIVFKGQIIELMNTPAEAIAQTKDYFFVCSLGIVFITGYNVVSNILRGLGDSKTPLIFVAVACLINILLDLLLVKGFGMGAMGAAIATVAAQAGSFFFSLLYLTRKGVGIAFTKKDIKAHSSHIKRVLSIGLPLAFQNILVTLSFLLILLVINKMGVVASAAVGIVEKLIELLMMPAIAFGGAVAVMSAQNYGAGKLKRARKCMWCGVGLTLLFAIISTTVCQVNGQILTSLFSTDPKVIEESAAYLKSYSLDCLLTCFIFNIGGYFNGTGHSLFNMVHNSLTSFGVRIPSTIFLSSMAGASMYTIGFAAPISSIVSIILCLGYLAFLSKINASRDIAANH